MAQDGGIPTLDTTAPSLSAGAINAITQDWRSAKDTHPDPVVQCLLIRPVAYIGGEVRYRGVMSDGEHWCLCLFTQALKPMIDERSIVKGSICRIPGYSHFTFNDEKEALIVFEIEILHDFGIPERIGNPRGAPPSPQRAIASSAFDPPMWHADRNVYPIGRISPFAREWAIKARVTSKSERGSQSDGDGPEDGGQGGCFRVTFADETGAIEATCGEGCGGFYELLEVGSWYHISSPCGFTFGLEDFELNFEVGTVVEKVED